MVKAPLMLDIAYAFQYPIVLEGRPVARISEEHGKEELLLPPNFKGDAILRYAASRMLPKLKDFVDSAANVKRFKLESFRFAIRVHPVLITSSPKFLHDTHKMSEFYDHAPKDVPCVAKADVFLRYAEERDTYLDAPPLAQTQYQVIDMKAVPNGIKRREVKRKECSAGLEDGSDGDGDAGDPKRAKTEEARREHLRRKLSKGGMRSLDRATATAPVPETAATTSGPVKEPVTKPSNTQAPMAPISRPTKGKAFPSHVTEAPTPAIPPRPTLHSNTRSAPVIMPLAPKGYCKLKIIPVCAGWPDDKLHLPIIEAEMFRDFDNSIPLTALGWWLHYIVLDQVKSLFSEQSFQYRDAGFKLMLSDGNPSDEVKVQVWPRTPELSGTLWRFSLWKDQTRKELNVYAEIGRRTVERPGEDPIYGCE